MGWLELITFTTQTFARVFKVLTFAVARLALYCVRLAAYPIAASWDILTFVFSPVTHIVRLLLSPLLWLLNSFPRLQPLYIYFGSAAFIGLLVGLLYKVTSVTIFTILNLYDDPNDAAKSSSSSSSSAPLKPVTKHQSYSRISSPFSDKQLAAEDNGYGCGFDDQDALSRPLTPDSQFRAEQRELEMLLASLSSQDSHSDRGHHRGSGSGSGRDAALALLAGSYSSSGGGGWRDGPNIKRKRRSVGGGPLSLGGRIGGLSSSSRFHTILEEEDDSL